MIWWGYAGLTGAIVISMAMLAAIVGLSSDVVLNIVMWSGGSLLGFGVAVHLCVLMLRSGGGGKPRTATARVEPAFARPVTPLTALQPLPAVPPVVVNAKPKIAQLQPGAVAVLFPQQAAE